MVPFQFNPNSNTRLSNWQSHSSEKKTIFPEGPNVVTVDVYPVIFGIF